MRSTEAEVKEIIETSLTDEQVAPFLKSANLLVTSVLTGQGYSDVVMADVERWLAAHFVSIRDPRAIKEKIGDAEDTYQGKFGEGLKGTSYGQQVLLIEYKGILAEISSTKSVATVEVIT